MLTITREQLQAFAPKARGEYVEALLNGLDDLKAAGILDTNLRLAHFMGQVGAETNYLQIVRESLTYTTQARLRAVWPARFRNKSDAYLQRYIRNPVALGAAVYGGRMGNAKAPSHDGYLYRGGGFLQTTGKSAVEKYCKRCGIPFDPDILDDIAATLKFACAEWVDSQCNKWADENDLLKVSKAINTGSATSGIMPVGMANRKAAFAKAWRVWGDAKHLDEVTDVTPDKLASRTIDAGKGLQAAGGVAAGATAAAKAIEETVAPAVPVTPPIEVKDLTEQITAFQQLTEASHAVAKLLLGNLWITGIIVGVVAVVFGRRIIRFYMEDVRLGRREARRKD